MFLEKVFHVAFCILLLFIYMKAVVDQLRQLGKRELICLLLFTCNYVVSVRRGFLFLWVLGMGYVILLWHSLSLPYNYFVELESPMLQAKFQDNRTSGSIEEDFQMFLPYMDVPAILDM